LFSGVDDISERCLSIGDESHDSFLLEPAGMIPFGKAMVDGECRHNDGSEVNNIDDDVDVNNCYI